MEATIEGGEVSFETARRAMVDNQIRTYDVTDRQVLAAFDTVAREPFLPSIMTDLAYSDAVLTVEGPGGTRRALITPMVLARMVQGLDLGPSDKVLVIAAGTGYAAAIVAQLCGAVVSLETDAGFAVAAGLPDVQMVTGPLQAGAPNLAPYDAILVTGGVEDDVSPLLDQLNSGGRLVAIHVSTHEATRRSGKVVRHDKLGTDISSRVLFDATAPVLDDFKLKPAFVF